MLIGVHDKFSRLGMCAIVKFNLNAAVVVAVSLFLLDVVHSLGKVNGNSSCLTLLPQELTKDAICRCLASSDWFHDEALPPLGVRLEDKNDTGNSVWKEKWNKKRVEAEQEAEQKAAQTAQAAKKEPLNRLPPAAFLKQLTLNDDDTTHTYTRFDESTGMPTHDSDGKPLTPKQIKKADKLFHIQQAKYAKWLQKSHQQP